jgi:hypothetical protein
MVVIFDRSNGERITDADVSARVSPLGLVGPEKELGAVTVADAPMYCDFFEMSKGDTYDIKVQIRRSNAASPVRTSFVYTAPTD